MNVELSNILSILIVIASNSWHIVPKISAIECMESFYDISLLVHTFSP